MSGVIVSSFMLYLCTVSLISVSLMLPTSFFPYWEYKLEAFYSFQMKEISDFSFRFFFHSLYGMKHRSKEQIKRGGLFSLCE